MPTKTSTKQTAAPAKKSTVKKTEAKIPAKDDAAENLRAFFEHCLKDLYWAEDAIAKELPKMAKNATSKKLKDALEGHLAETKTQIERLKEVFKAIGCKAEKEKCDAMQGLLDEGKSIMEETEPGAVRDAGIIAAAQKVEHYEIASYGTVATYAKMLGEKEALRLLLETLKEEKTCDKNLTQMAKSEVNIKAKKKS